MRGAAVVGTGAGAVVTTGADVVGGVVTGAAGATGAGVAADGATEAEGADPPDTVGAGAVREPDETEDAEDAEDVAAGEGVFGGDPALGGTVVSVAVPDDDVTSEPTTPVAPVTFNSTIGTVDEPDGALSASAATIAVVAARLNPAVKARDAGATEPRRFARSRGGVDEDAAARAAAGMRSVIVILFALALTLPLAFGLALRGT